MDRRTEGVVVRQASRGKLASAATLLGHPIRRHSTDLDPERAPSSRTMQVAPALVSQEVGAVIMQPRNRSPPPLGDPRQHVALPAHAGAQRFGRDGRLCRTFGPPHAQRSREPLGGRRPIH